LYRFRNVDNLLGKYQELEKQQIYFASRDELNDPLEGTLRYFWQGDKIVWENFLKHYLLCLEHVVFLSRLMKDDESITKRDIPIFKSEIDLPTIMYKERIQKINDLFFADTFVQMYLRFILKNPNKIYIEEMYFHLKMLSSTAIKVIFDIDMQSGLIPNQQNTHSQMEEQRTNIDLAEFWDGLNDKDASYSLLMQILHDYLKSMDSELLLKYKDSPKLQSIFIEFPQMYLDSVVKLTYPETYVACFMDNCNNSSIWGTYGVNHTGVCLKFKVNDDSPVLPLKTIRGFSTSSGNILNYINHPLKPMDYSSSFDEVDFFRNIGRLTIKQLKEQWYSNEDGELSICCEGMLSREEEWRNNYWKTYEPAYLKKLPSWSHEREYRIIINSVLDTFDKPKNRLLEYRFEDLEAIIFGVKTPKEARTEIIEIVKRKCEESGRDQFEFFEMAFSNRTNELYPRKIISLNFNNQ
jgi:hypothetical protein